MPFFIPLLFIGATVAGGVTQAQAAKQEASDAKAMMDYNARVKEQEAKAAEQKGIFESRRQAEAGSRQMAALEAGIGGAGAIPTAGSPLLVEAKQASEIELENLVIGQNTITEAANLRNQGQLYSAQGRIYKRAGRNKATAAYMNTGTTVLSGLYNMGTFDSLNNFGKSASIRNPRNINQSINSNTWWT